jgi:TonB-dependent receptor
VIGSVLPTTGLVPVTEFERQNYVGARLPVLDPAAISTTLSNTALWTEDVNYNAIEKYRSTRILEEGVDSAYVQASSKIGRFSILGGVRAESVKTETFYYVAASAAKRTPIAVEPDPLKRAILDYTPSSRDGDYVKYFPSAHLAYDLTANLKLRTSWSKSYGRPRLQDLVASPTAVDPTGTATGTVTVGNPNLKPALATNYDVRVDWAFSKRGFFSVRYFDKAIKDYIGSSTRSGFLIPEGADNGFSGQYVGYELIQPNNIGTTKSKGVEVDFRQQLTFLPGALKGLTLRANYTNVQTRAVFNGLSYAPGQVVGSAGQWYIPRTYNVGLNYVYKKFGASWDMNYTSQFPIAYSLTAPQNNIFRETRTLMAAGITYQVRPEATLFLNVANIDEEGISEYRYIPTRHYRGYNTPRSLKLGVTGRF